MAPVPFSAYASPPSCSWSLNYAHLETGADMVVHGARVRLALGTCAALSYKATRDQYVDGRATVQAILWDVATRGLVLTLERCWHTLFQHRSGEVLERSNSRLRQVLAQSVLTAGSRGVRTHR